MEVGIKGDCSFVVTKEMLATAVGSGTVEVFATPAMIARMEDTATRSVMPYLDEGQATVGTHVDVRHLDATPEGMKVKFLTFTVEARDEHGVIGSGIHERAIINVSRFMEKVNKKKNV